MDDRPCAADILCRGEFDCGNSDDTAKEKRKKFCGGGIQRNIFGFFFELLNSFD